MPEREPKIKYDYLIQRITGVNSGIIILFYVALFFICLWLMIEEVAGAAVMVLLAAIICIFWIAYNFCESLYQQSENYNRDMFLVDKYNQKIDQLETLQKEHEDLLHTNGAFFGQIQELKEANKFGSLDETLADLTSRVKSVNSLTDNQEECFLKLAKLTDKAFKRSGKQGIFDMANVMPEVKRLNQIETIMNEYSIKRKSVQNDKSIDEEERKEKLEIWRRLRDSEIDEIT